MKAVWNDLNLNFIKVCSDWLIAVLLAPDWSVEDVGTWLDSLGLADYKEKFSSHDIMGKELLNLGRQDLKVCGILSFNVFLVGFKIGMEYHYTARNW